MHLDGELGAPNPEAAVNAFTRGATAQDGPALVSLGYLHLVGSHVAKDPSKARDLFQQATTKGETIAHHYLGYLAETDAPQTGSSEQQAAYHYKQAAADNHPPALMRLSELAFASAQPAEGLSYLRAFVAATRPGGRVTDMSLSLIHI